MGSMRFDIDKFNGSNDFGLWRIKMRAILIQQGLADALKKDDESADTKKEKGQTDILENAMSAIIL